MASVVPFAGSDDDAHVIVFPRVGCVRQIFVGAVEVNVVVVVAVEKRTDVEGTTQTDEVADKIGMAKGDVPGVIGAQAGAAHGHTVAMTFSSREIEHVAHNNVFVGIVRSHAIGRMNRLVIEAVEIDGVRTVNREFAGIDIAGDRADQAEIFVLIITAEGGWKQNQRETAAIAESEHFKLATQVGCVPFDVAFVHG